MKKDILLLICVLIITVIGFTAAVFSVSKMFINSIDNLVGTYDITKE
jgi:hypothetical protein